MSGQHTPGPWEWDAGIIPPDGPGRYAVVYVNDEDGEPITIAEFNDSLPEGRFNARLIASAPELLEALEGLLAYYLRIEGKEPGPHTPFGRAAAAIAKATGQ